MQQFEVDERERRGPFADGNLKEGDSKGGKVTLHFYYGGDLQLGHDFCFVEARRVVIMTLTHPDLTPFFKTELKSPPPKMLERPKSRTTVYNIPIFHYYYYMYTYVVVVPSSRLHVCFSTVLLLPLAKVVPRKGLSPNCGQSVKSH